ncbi:MAG: quinone oxidoreductase [Rickettsiales bacterium]|nr:quinone oxidoreductase [Rickettsiales bacterium]
MRAMVIRAFGGPEVFEETEMTVPEPGEGQVRLKVVASSFNPIESKIRAGWARIGPEFPAVLNSDVAGRIDRVGPGVSDFAEGDEVFALSGGIQGGQGALAEFTLVDARLLARKPASLSMAECAALPIGFITSWYALCRMTQIHAGQKVLVHGGTGGVGHIAVQLARAKGCEVYATVSSDQKAELARSLGAHFTIDRRSETPEQYVARYTGGKGFDLVFDTAGGVSLDNAFVAACYEGEVVTVNARASHDLTPAHVRGLSIHLVMILRSMLLGLDLEHYGAILREAARLADEGSLRPLMDSRSFSVWDVAEAHRYAATGASIGKISLTL